jgi:hypothetical protein
MADIPQFHIIPEKIYKGVNKNNFETGQPYYRRIYRNAEKLLA